MCYRNSMEEVGICDLCGHDASDCSCPECQNCHEQGVVLNHNHFCSKCSNFDPVNLAIDQFLMMSPKQQNREVWKEVFQEARHEKRCRNCHHKWKDVSTAGPDSGDMDVECTECGWYISAPLY